MKTILFKEIDGYEILTGFGNPAVDPIETRKAAGLVLETTEEYKQLAALRARNAEVQEQRRMAMTDLKKEKDPAKRRDAENRYKDAMMLAEQLESQAAELAPRFAEKERTCLRDNAVYFEPRPGERIVEDAEVGRLTVAVDAAGPGYLVDTAGTAVPDFRGKVFWLKTADGWTRQDVNTIGIEPVGKPYEDLNDSERLEVQEQLESERVAGLKAEEKNAEKAAAVDAAASQAALMRSKLEIQGDAKALDKAREWYDAEVVRIEALYA
jgi:hypothetical protein